MNSDTESCFSLEPDIKFVILWHRTPLPPSCSGRRGMSYHSASAKTDNNISAQIDRDLLVNKLHLSSCDLAGILSLQVEWLWAKYLRIFPICCQFVSLTLL